MSKWSRLEKGHSELQWLPKTTYHQTGAFLVRYQINLVVMVSLKVGILLPCCSISMCRRYSYIRIMSFSKLLQNVDKFFWRILPNKIKF
jgi:hypothetical protein